MFGSLQTPDAALNLSAYRSLEIMVGVGVSYLAEIAFAQPAEPRSAQSKPGILGAPIDEGLLVIALTGGIATASIPVIWEALQLPGLDQTPITAFVILLSMRREPAWTALNRMAGCVIGGIYGLLCMRLVGDDMAAWLALVFVGLYVTCHVKNGGRDGAYGGHQAAIAIIMSMVQGLAPSSDILPAINRLVGIVGGIVVVMAAQTVVAPLVARALRYLLPADAPTSQQQ
jgi:uncharacterized membrane protein YccC